VKVTESHTSETSCASMNVSDYPSPLPPPTGIDIGINLTYLIICTALGAMLFPTLFALFFFSTSSLRRSAIFILNVISILLGIGQAAFTARTAIKSILSPFAPESIGAVLTASNVLLAMSPIFVDSILLLRLAAVFPYHRTPRITWFGVMLFPIAMKIFRIVNISIFSHHIQSVFGANDPELEVAASIIQIGTWINTKLEWIAQLLDNTYMSAVFLWRLHTTYSFNNQVSFLKNDSTSFSSKLLSLMWIATFNFVFPVLFNLTQLIVGYGASDYTISTYVDQANFQITIIGVVFATVWVSYTKWADEHSPDVRAALSSLSFARFDRGPSVEKNTQKLDNDRLRLPQVTTFDISYDTERSEHADSDLSASSVKDGTVSDGRSISPWTFSPASGCIV